MIQRLRQGERITVPKLGTFLIKDQPKQYQRRRFGRRQTVFRQRTRVAFRPTKALRILLENLREPATAVAQRKDKRHACEKCGSTMFEEGEFRQYTQQSCSTPGKDLKPITEGLPMRAAIVFAAIRRARSGCAGPYEAIRPVSRSPSRWLFGAGIG